MSINATRTMVDGFVITEARAYLDTITLFSRQPLPHQVFREVRRLQKKPLVSRVIRITDNGECRLASLFFSSIHQPTVATMGYLAPMHDRKFTLHAAHVAFDFLVADEQQALNAQVYFDRHLQQKWRRRQDCWSEHNSLYWRIDRKAPRNIALYSDRPSKTGSDHCCHLELKFTGADACRRAGLSSLRQLSSGIDAFSILARNSKVSTVDAGRLDRAIERAARQFLPNTKRHYPVIAVKGARTELTVALLKVKMRQLLERSLISEIMDNSGVRSIRSQELWDSSHRWLRSALVEVPWGEITPEPTWHAWR